MNKLQQQIHDYITTLNEYEAGTHVYYSGNCVKCIRAKAFNDDSHDVDCSKCPESIHKSVVGCYNRNTSAGPSKYISFNRRTNIINYHKQAIKFLKNMKRFNMKSFQRELLRIDAQFKNHE